MDGSREDEVGAARASVRSWVPRSVRKGDFGKCILGAESESMWVIVFEPF